MSVHKVKNVANCFLTYRTKQAIFLSSQTYAVNSSGKHAHILKTSENDPGKTS